MGLVDAVNRVIKRLPIYWQQYKTIVNNEGIFKANLKTIKKASRFIITGGSKARLSKLNYKDWQKNIESEYLNDVSMKKDYRSLNYKPKFSVIFPVWNKSKDMLWEALKSIEDQSYDNWEICISDGTTDEKYIKETKEFLTKFQEVNKEKIKYSTIPVQKDVVNIIENTNNALSMATGDYVVFMDCDDELAPNCLLEIAKSLNDNPNYDFIYSDFDKIDQEGNRYDPSFWPDWSPHTLTAQMYTTHVTCYERELVNELGGLVKGTEGAQDWDLVLRYVTRNKYNVCHIPKILYHWRVYIGSTALSNSGAKNWAYENQKNVIQRYLDRRKLKGEVLEGPFSGAWRIKFAINNNPKVSIVIPTKDYVNYLKDAVDSIRKHTTYDNYEIVIINNNSTEKETLSYFDKLKKEKKTKVLDWNHPYHFGRLYNWAVNQVDGDYILILNNDVKVINDGWLTEMLGWCQLPEVGCVGAKLFYPNGRIQHAGVIVGTGGAAAHSHRLCEGDDFGYEGAVSNIRDYLAVTGACLLISKKLYLNLNGFDEDLDPAYQDVDLCIRAYEKGFYNIYTPYAQLIHYESITRLDDKNKEELVKDEINAEILRNKWPKYIEARGGDDPFYNPNLSYAHEDFRIRRN